MSALKVGNNAMKQQEQTTMDQAHSEPYIRTSAGGAEPSPATPNLQEFFMGTKQVI